MDFEKSKSVIPNAQSAIFVTKTVCLFSPFNKSYFMWSYLLVITLFFYMEEHFTGLLITINSLFIYV